MKYKIVIVNFNTQKDSDAPLIALMDESWNREYTAAVFRNRIERQWENGEGWFALKLYGVHIFETDDLKTFDLLEAQRQKDEPARQIHLELEANKYIDTAPMQRKAEIKRIAEILWVHREDISTRESIEIASRFVDNFDAEFEKWDK